jgi:DNA-binding SARP family transcriptional activator/tetratricopeptide (TPR) repeat protein
MDGDTPSFRFRVLGPFAVFRDGEPLPDRAIGSRKGRTLLKLLLTERGHVVPSDRIYEVLWGESTPAKLQENVAALVSRLRALLGRDAIIGGPDGYALHLSSRLDLDLDEAERMTSEAESRLVAGEPALGRVAADRALQCLEGGRFLEDEPYKEWAHEAEVAVETLRARARRAAWQAALELGEHPRAVEIATHAVRDDSLNEEAHRAIILANALQGSRASALAAYERLRALLADELGIDPSPESQALYLRILRAEDLRPEMPPRATRRDSDRLFVGRKAELELLSAHWKAAVEDHPAFVLITGEAGIGKSRLAAEISALVVSTGGLVLSGRCYEAERSLFLQPLLQATRSAIVTLPPDVVREAAGDWGGTLAELIPEVASVLRPLGYRRAPPEVEHRRSFEAMTSFLRDLARRQPVLLSLDDLHLASHSTIELLHFLIGRLSSARLLVVATARQEEMGDILDLLGDTVRRVQLAPLSDTAVADLARAMGAGDVSDELIKLTGGHTLYVIEALRAVIESDPSGGIPIPPSLRDAVLARTRRAGPEVEELLRAAAVLGTVFEIDLVAEILGLPVEDAIRRAERALSRSLVREAGRVYEFANDLIRNVLYETTPRPTLVSRHRKAACLIRDQPEPVALHASAAEDWTEAFHAWMHAAERPRLSFANRDAERLYSKALAVADRLGDAALTARALIARGGAREGLGEYPLAARDHSRALAAAREVAAADLEAAALERLAWTAYFARDLIHAADEDVSPLALAERAAEAPGAAPSALVLVGRLRHARGDLGQAASAFRAVLDGPGDAATRASAQSYLGAVLEHGDNWREARLILDQAVERCRASGAFRPLLSGLFFGGMAQANLGDLGAALTTFERLGGVIEEFDAPFYRPRVLTSLSWVWRELGDLARARDLARESSELLDELGPGRGQIEPRGHAMLAAAECALMDGDQGEAARVLDVGEALLGGDHGFIWRLELRYLELWARLEPPRAEALLERARVAGSRKYEALALAALGRTGEASRLARELGSDYLVAQVAPAQEAAEAVARMTRSLPPGLRGSFVDRGRVPVAVATATTRGGE